MGAGTVRCVPWAALGCFIRFLHCSHPPAQPLGDGETEARVAGRGEGRANDKLFWYTQLSPVVAMRPRTHSCPLPTTAPPPHHGTFPTPAAVQGAALLTPATIFHRAGGAEAPMPPSPVEPPTTLPSPHPSNTGVPHSAPPAQNGGSAALGVLPRGQTETGNTQRASGFVSCRPPSPGITRQPPAPELPPQASAPHPAPGHPLPSTYFRREPARGAAGGGQGPATSLPAAGHPAPSAPSPSGTPRAPSPSHLGRCCPVSGPARRVRPVPGERRDRGGPRGPCPDPAAPSLLFSAAAHKIFSLTTVRARARACLGNREGENRAAPPRRSGWEGRAASCLSFPSHSRRIQVVLAGGRQESSQQPMETPGAAQKGQLKGHSASQGESGVPGRLWGPHRAAALQ